MADAGFTLYAESLTEPHHVDGDCEFVKTLIRAYEEYTGLKGGCQSTGGGVSS